MQNYILLEILVLFQRESESSLDDPEGMGHTNIIVWIIWENPHLSNIESDETNDIPKVRESESSMLLGKNGKTKIFLSYEFVWIFGVKIIPCYSKYRKSELSHYEWGMRKQKYYKGIGLLKQTLRHEMNQFPYHRLCSHFADRFWFKYCCFAITCPNNLQKTP